MQDAQWSKENLGQEREAITEEQKQKFGHASREIADECFRRGKAPKDAVGMDNQMLENIYAQAYRLYNTGKYTEASHLFRILIMMDATEQKYMLGLAACLHMLKEYENALSSYTLCNAIDPKNPIPYYHSSDCYIQLKDFLSAMVSLEMTIAHSGDKPEYAKMKERAALTLENLKRQPLFPEDEEQKEEA